MKDYAVLRMFDGGNGSHNVKLDANDDFMELEPLDRAIYLNAALHLCVAGINAILDDNPDDADEIMDHLEAMAIAVKPPVRN